MGQGHSMTTLPAASATIDVPELADLSHDKILASGRFMKSVRARSSQGFVFVKAVVKPYSSFDVRGYVQQITGERNALARIPNTLPYQRIVEVGNGGFLVRQYIFSSVYDRLSTRPFLENVEKRWLAFQLLCAVRDCHALGIYHGDIKTENLLVTSWNWLFLSDFTAAFKPTKLPEDNPADFSFYFDTSSRRICYVAPERFISAGMDDSPDELNWSMDMFSVGCVIAEIFLEGPIFTLSQIFKYKRGDYSPEHAHINKITDLEVRAMVLNMIDLDPEKRYSAEQHLAFYSGKIFPEYFYSFLHDYMQDLTVSTIREKPASLEADALGECDIKIERLYHDFDKISYFLGYNSPLSRTSSRPHRHRDTISRNNANEPVVTLSDGTLLFLALVSSGLRSTSKASARLKACDLLVAFAERLPDEAKLDRILPYIVGLLSDDSDTVKIAALQVMTRILDLVEVVSPINAYLFPEYIFPKLRQFVIGSNGSPSPLVRASYASCLASLAQSSARMLDMVQAIRADGRLPALSNEAWAPDTSYHGLYDIARAELIPHFEEATTLLITDPETVVRRALLSSVSRLCVFFGSSRASDVILSHLNTYLNDKDWILRCSFYEALVGIASYVGTSSLEQYILPLMVGSLTDPEHFVVEKVLRSLSRMAALGLFQKSVTWEISSIASRFLVHPSAWLREAAVQFLAQASKYLSAADRYCILLPILQPFLKYPVATFSEEKILDGLKLPLPRPLLEAAILWATKKRKSLFWTAANRDGVFILSNLDGTTNPVALAKRLPNRIPPSQKDKDDQSSLESLRNFGLTIDDEVKLLALREYIVKIATSRVDDGVYEKQLFLGNIVSLSQIKVTPQTVFFDHTQPFRKTTSRSRSKSNLVDIENSRSLADALLDASTTLDDLSRPFQGQMMADHGGEPVPARPINIEQASKKDSVDGNTPGTRVGSDRPNIRIQGLKSENSRRASSVGARHALLDSEGMSANRRGRGELTPRNSAVNLTRRADSMKADAEISTTPETAFGKLDTMTQKRQNSQHSILSSNLDPVGKDRSKSPANQQLSGPTYEANHSYSGGDATVIRLLDNHLAENFPVDLVDFGPSRQAADDGTPIKRAIDLGAQPTASQAVEAPVYHDEPWRPLGQLMTQFAEHVAPITRVVAAPDHAFFITGSEDGTVKVWDTARLEKNLTSKSRQTHRHSPGARVVSLCFVENTHTFISAASDGSIHAVKVDYKLSQGGESARYGKITLVRDYQIPQDHQLISGEREASETENEHAIWLYHYRTPNSKSILLAATNRCRILMFDMKNMDLMHVMVNPSFHGVPTTFCIDRKHHWLLLGTSHGILDLWDLRFQLRLRAFGLGGATMGKRVDRLLLHPGKGHGRWIIVSCGGELSIWDLEKMICREVLRPSTFVPATGQNQASYEAWLPDENSGKEVLSNFARVLQTDEAALEPVLMTVNGQASSDSGKHQQQGKGSAPGIHALFALNDYLANPAQPENPNKSTIILSAGEDRTIRYWDLAHVDQSFILSGPVINVVGGSAVAKSRYETSWPTSMSLSGLVQLVEEKLSETNSEEIGDDSKAVKGTPQKRKGTTAARTPPSKEEKGAENATSKLLRNTVISAAQQQLLRTHMDGITDVCVLRKPYGCIVSVDRSGCIYIFL